MYVTPHAWTSFSQQIQDRLVVQTDPAKWDYRHQVLAQQALRPWQLFLAVKWLELRFHLTPRRVWAHIRGEDRFRRRQRRWVFRHISLVWLAEILEFVFSTSFANQTVTFAESSHPHTPRARPQTGPVVARRSL